MLEGKPVPGIWYDAHDFVWSSANQFFIYPKRGNNAMFFGRKITTRMIKMIQAGNYYYNPYYNNFEVIKKTSILVHNLENSAQPKRA